MITVRQIQRLWDERQYRRMMVELTAARPEASPHLVDALSKSATAAAMAVIRLDELGQAYVPLYSQLIKAVLWRQESDGGWGDPLATALCLKALLTGEGAGPAVDAAIDYLVNLQKENGAWPHEPIRRMDGDAYTTAFILFHLADHPMVASRLRIEAATGWLQAQQSRLDAVTRKLWERLRCRMQLRSKPAQEAVIWS